MTIHMTAEADAMTKYLSGTPVAAVAVEVWCRSFSEWVPGFAVVATAPEGLVVRRQSDGSTLPICFDPANVRRAD